MEAIGKAVTRAWTVTVKSGAGLRAADGGGKSGGGSSDPYFYLSVLDGSDDGNQLFYSKGETVKKTLNPQWGHTVVVPEADGNASLVVTVVDWDRFGKNDYLGQGVLRMRGEQGLWALREPRLVELPLDGPMALKVFKGHSAKGGGIGGLLGRGRKNSLGAELEEVGLNEAEVPGEGSVAVEVRPHFASTSAALRVQRQEKKNKWSDETW